LSSGCKKIFVQCEICGGSYGGPVDFEAGQYPCSCLSQPIDNMVHGLRKVLARLEAIEEVLCNPDEQGLKESLPTAGK